MRASDGDRDPRVLHGMRAGSAVKAGVSAACVLFPISRPGVVTPRKTWPGSLGSQAWAGACASGGFLQPEDSGSAAPGSCRSGPRSPVPILRLLRLPSHLGRPLGESLSAAVTVTGLVSHLIFSWLSLMPPCWVKWRERPILVAAGVALTFSWGDHEIPAAHMDSLRAGVPVRLRGTLRAPTARQPFPGTDLPSALVPGYPLPLIHTENQGTEGSPLTLPFLCPYSPSTTKPYGFILQNTFQSYACASACSTGSSLDCGQQPPPGPLLPLPCPPSPLRKTRPEELFRL